MRTLEVWKLRWCAMIATGIGMLGLQVSTSSACDCSPAPVESIVAEADAIFIGRVVSQDDDRGVPTECHPYRRINFRVLTAWRGIDNEMVGLATEHGCFGLQLNIDDELLLFAYRDDAIGRLSGGGCSAAGGGLGELYKAAIINELGEGSVPAVGNDSNSPPFVLLSVPNPDCGAWPLSLCGIGVFIPILLSICCLAGMRFRPRRRWLTHFSHGGTNR